MVVAVIFYVAGTDYIAIVFVMAVYYNSIHCLFLTRYNCVCGHVGVGTCYLIHSIPKCQETKGFVVNFYA